MCRQHRNALGLILIPLVSLSVSLGISGEIPKVSLSIAVEPVLPVSVEKPVIRVHFHNTGKEAAVFTVPKKNELQAYRSFTVEVDGHSAARLLRLPEEAHVFFSRRVILKPGETFIWTVSLADIYAIPKQWKQIVITPTDIPQFGGTVDVICSSVLQYLPGFNNVEQARLLKIILSKNAILSARLDAIERLAIQADASSLSILLSYEKKTRTKDLIHYYLVKALYDRFRRGTGKNAFDALCQIAENQEGAANKRLLSVEVLGIVLRGDDLFNGIPGYSHNEKEKQKARSILMEISTRKPKDMQQKIVHSYVKKLLATGGVGSLLPVK